MLCSLNAHVVLGSGKGALMYSIFGGDVIALRAWLDEERFLDGWEPRNREALGHTITVFSTLPRMTFPY